MGIDAPEGSRAVLTGIETDDEDKELLRIMNILQNGVEPKLPKITPKVFKIDEKKFVFLFRVSRSWIRPHRVKSNRKFHARKSNGKFEIDVYELRQLFAESSNFTKLAKEFREERVLEYHRKFEESPFTLVHLIPISSFENRFVLDMSLVTGLKLNQMGVSSGWSPRINFKGIYSEDSNKGSTLQIFRNGIIEGATRYFTYDKAIALVFVVEELVEFVKNQTLNYKIMGMDEPFYVSVSMFGVSGHYIAADQFKYFSPTDRRTLTEDKLIFPEVLIESREKIEEKLTPIFDALCNAFGFIKFEG